MNSASQEYSDFRKQYTRREFLKGSIKRTAEVVVGGTAVLLSLPSGYSQNNNALEIPEAKVTPDMSTGKWLSNEFAKEDSLELQATPYKNMPSNATPLPYLRLNHDASNWYTLSALARETTLKNDIASAFILSTADRSNLAAISFSLKGSGDSPENYKLQIDYLLNKVADFSSVEAVWSYDSSIYNQQKHVIMKMKIPIDAIQKYQTSDVNGVFNFEAELGNTSSYADWYGKVYLSSPVDFFPPGIANPTLAATLFATTTGIVAFKKFSERKTRLGNKRKQ